MNCDLVFDILTRGPFPSGDAHDADVEIHLAGCHECRRLAEALRPAVELLHEAVHPDEGSQLPGYRGNLGQSRSGDLATTVAESIRRQSLPARRRAVRPMAVGRPASWGPTIGLSCVALGLCLSVLLLAQGRFTTLFPRGAATDGPPVPLGSPAASLDLEGLETLVALNLPAACLDESQIQPTRSITDQAGGPATAMHTFLCCSHCHHAAANRRGPRPPVASITQVAQRCLLCHK